MRMRNDIIRELRSKQSSMSISVKDSLDLINSCPQQSMDVFHFYADADNGSDNYSGFFANNAKKTLQGVFDILPDFIKHNTCVHLAGTFAEQEGFISKFVVNGAVLLIDGGDACKVVWGSGGSGADIGDLSCIGLTGAKWAKNKYQGYWVQLLNDDEVVLATRLIQDNDESKIVVKRDFNVDPKGLMFRIVRPATTLVGNGKVIDATRIVNECVGATSAVDMPAVHMQRLFVKGSKAAIQHRSIATGWLSHVVSKSTQDGGLLVCGGKSYSIVAAMMDPVSFEWVSLNESAAGFSHLNDGSIVVQHVDDFSKKASMCKVSDGK